jgi:hypothetical protein
MPHDYYRFTPSSLEDLARSAGFEVVSIRPRGGYVAVALRVLQLPITKFWQKLARATRLPLYHPLNPLVFATVVLPEWLCLAAWRRGRRRPGGRLARIGAKLTYFTLGYVTRLHKPK